MNSEISLGEDFATSLLAGAAEHPPEEPLAFYNDEGDCIEFLFSSESYYGERVDDLLTVYQGRDSGQIIGALIKGVKRFVRHFTQTAPGFLIEIQDHKVRLGCLVTAGMWRVGDELIVKKYKLIRDKAEEMGVEVEMPALTC